ncbi:MAG TPA: hypothetical protein VGS96_17500 [Thermoanaerobaculia bacterium]|jgi:hypothetical protein|nr:hypothetical protein [Thermoanaerobaculia bacterium]
MTAQARRFLSQFQLLDLRPSRPKPTLVPPLPPVEIQQREAVRNLRAALDPAIARNVISATELIRALEKTRREDFLPTAIDALDALLGGGLRRGKVVELVSRRAVGRFSIVMSTLAAATSIGEAAALIDVSDHFDPQIADVAGVDLRRLLWVRPKTMKQAVMAAEMITVTGFQLVVLDAGLHPVRGRRAPDAAWVRLARAAEAHGAAMLVSTPYPFTGTTSEAVVRGEKARVKWLGQGKSPRLLVEVTTNFRLEKHRHMKPGAPATCDLRPAIS